MSTPALCGAKTSSGEPCRKYPIAGATRCLKHGSGNPAALAAAKRNVLTARLNHAVQERGWAPVTNPALLLASVAGEAEAFKDLAREKLNELDDWESVNRLGSETVKAVVAVYAAALRDVATVAEKLWRLGIDHTALQLEAERPAREQATALGRVVERALTGAGFDADQVHRFRAAFADAIRAEGLAQ